MGRHCDGAISEGTTSYAVLARATMDPMPLMDQQAPRVVGTGYLAPIPRDGRRDLRGVVQDLAHTEGHE